jgi:hypothetical protein
MLELEAHETAITDLAVQDGGVYRVRRNRSITTQLMA